MLESVAHIVNETGDTNLADFLSQHLLAILNSVDREMLRSKDPTLRRHALNCIGSLIVLITDHLSKFAPKFMSLLTWALQEEAARVQCLGVWMTFVRTMAQLAPTNLKMMASQVSTLTT